MMNNKLLTVIVPSYNMERFLAKCLQSLIVDDEQVRELLEVIVVNDGSKDKTSAIAHQYANSYPDTFMVIDKDNGHYGSCINVGLKCATGKYVRVLDADDSYDTTNFKGFLRYLAASQNDTPDLILSDVEIVNDHDEVFHKEGCWRVGESVVGLDAKLAYELRNVGLPYVTYLLERLKKIDYRQTEHVCYSDTQWVTLPFVSVKTVCRYPHAVYRYLRGREGQSMDSAFYRTNRLKMTAVCVMDSIRQMKRVEIGSDPGCQYAVGRLLSSIKGIYDWAFFDSGEPIPDDFLQKFDTELQVLSPEYYEKCSGFTIGKFKFHYITLWRKHQSSKTLLFRGLLFLKRHFRKGR